MIRQNIGIGIGVLETVAQALGVPVAGSLAAEIVKSCDDVGRHKVSVVPPSNSKVLLSLIPVSNLIDDRGGLNFLE